MSFGILIRNGVIVDGTGNPWFRADLAVKDGKIKQISRTNLEGGEEILDAKGLIVAPGFIDVHNHSDASALRHNRAENALFAGWTTMGVGNCGFSSFPVTAKYEKGIKEHVENTVVDWKTLAEWRQRVEDNGIGANLAPYVGHNTIRGCVMGVEGEGGERYEPTPQEMDEMTNLVDQAMRDGAFGLSSGLAFPPGRNALTSELVELCKVVAKYGGFYTSHMRDNGDKAIEAVLEFIEICEKARVRGFMSHLMTLFPWNFGKPVEMMRLVDKARSKGLDILCDVVPWAPYIGGMILTPFAYLPFRSEARTRTELLEILKTHEKWEKMREQIIEVREEEQRKGNERKKELEDRGLFYPEKDFHHFPGMVRGIAYSKSRPDLQGKTLDEATKLAGKSDYVDLLRELYVADEGYTVGFGAIISEEDMLAILKHPTSMISSDLWQVDFSKTPFSVMAENLQYPFAHHSMVPRVLQKYVREEGVLGLEEAIRKATSLPAQTLRLKCRGVIKEGNWADIVIFDAEKIRENANYADPSLPPSGIHYVLINGTVVVKRGEHTGALPGKVLFHKP